MHGIGGAASNRTDRTTCAATCPARREPWRRTTTDSGGYSTCDTPIPLLHDLANIEQPSLTKYSHSRPSISVGVSQKELRGQT